MILKPSRKPLSTDTKQVNTLKTSKNTGNMNPVPHASCFTGFMCGTNVLDKDGISAAMVLSELATYLYGSNTTLHNKLDEIYKTFVSMTDSWLLVKFFKTFLLIAIG